MKPRAIVIQEWNRPKYLYVSLEALHAVRGVDDWDLFVSLDGVPTSKFKWVQEAFPKVSFFYLGAQYGCWGNVMRSVNKTFSMGYDSVLHFPGDVIIRSDSIEYLNNLNQKAFFYCLMRHGGIKGLVEWYAPRGVLIEKDNWRILNQWIEEKKFIGLPYPNAKGSIITKDHHSSDDDIFTAFTLHEHRPMLFPENMTYSFHFGIRGINKHFDPALEEAMFKGDPKTWLSNVVTAAKTSKNPCFGPPDFVYA